METKILEPMKDRQMKIRALFRLSIISALLLSVGCQSDSNPWQVEKYRSPGEFTPTPQSTYAPVPRILPSVEGVAPQPLDSGDQPLEELEMILKELHAN